jgi:agmatine/peptidylarginine deiminase
VRYIALITGEGEGCDYTIDCNKRFEIIERATDVEAIIWAKELLDEDGHDRIENIQLFSVEAEVALDQDNAEMQSELEELEAQADELRQKMKKRGEK